MTLQALESQVMAKVAEDYRRRGYDVEVVPRGPGLPEFLGGFQPDLIARSPAESVVVEVKVGTRTSVAERFREVAERVNRQPGWRFSLVFVSPDQPDQISEAQPAPLSLLQKRVQNADTLLQEGQSEAAFLLLFSAIEGILRFLGQRARLPLESLPPSTLIRELYSAGEINRDQFESLMRFLPIRNQLVHGFESQESLDVVQLRQLVQALLAEAESGESEQPA
jgi:REase_AHJR-like